MSEITSTLESQRDFFAGGKTRSYEFRKERLETLKDLLHTREKEIFEALQKDLRKCEFESFIGEVGITLDEINHTLKHLKGWMKTRKVSTPIALFPAKSYIHPEPFGNVLVLAPWNYPFQLAIAPLVGAIAAGNTAIVKPSELAPYTSAVIAKLLKEKFDPAHVAVIEGGIDVNTALLKERFDLIFFTGSPMVGKIVMRAAAEHLTPVVLELGGKSPCFVDHDADLALTAKRITWGKFLNAGQTCVAPDYLLAHKSIKSSLVEEMKKAMRNAYGEKPLESPDYPRIINERHFKRLIGLMQDQKVLAGGDSSNESRYIAPTLIDADGWETPLMQEEIFGPILPILEFEDLDEAIAKVNARPKPLALYYFGNSSDRQAAVINKTSSGGACINDLISHLLNPNLPFGGVGESGMGSYHGKGSFDVFTHEKSVLRNYNFPDPPVRYAPYEGKIGLLRYFMG